MQTTKSPVPDGAGLFCGGLFSFEGFILCKSGIEILTDGSPVGTEREEVRSTGVSRCIVGGKRIPDV